MAKPSIKILFIEDNPADARLVGELILDVCRQGKEKHDFELEYFDRLSKALDYLSKHEVQVILTDIGLPDSEGLEIINKLQAIAPTAPIVVLTGNSDEETLGFQAIHLGAEDYFIKLGMTGRGLVRAIKYAIERKHMRLELQATQLQLIEAVKMQSIGRLAAGVAHEVKNPLAIILMGIEYLSKNIATGKNEMTKVLADMMRAVRRADKVIKGLLNFSSPKKLDLKPTDLNQVLEKTLSLARHAFVEHHVSIHKMLSKALPPVNLDSNKMEHVFVNIFMNAFDAMPEEGGTLILKTLMEKLTPSDHKLLYRENDHFKMGDDVVIIEIENTGSSIPDENLEKIFEPFFTTKGPRKGTGLGLAITKTIIELHKGVIKIGNRKEGGVRVSIMLKMG